MSVQSIVVGPEPDANAASRQSHQGLRADTGFPHSAAVHVLVLMVVGIQSGYYVHAYQFLLES